MRRRSPVRGRGPALLAAVLVAAALGVAASLTGALPRLENDTISLRFELRGPQPAPDVAVVAIDDRTFDELAVRWPMRRRLHARAIDRLRQAGARLIVYDLQFTEPTNPRDDLALYDAVARARGVVLATTETDD